MYCIFSLFLCYKYGSFHSAFSPTPKEVIFVLFGVGASYYHPYAIEAMRKSMSYAEKPISMNEDLHGRGDTMIMGFQDVKSLGEARWNAEVSIF